VILVWTILHACGAVVAIKLAYRSLRQKRAQCPLYPAWMFAPASPLVQPAILPKVADGVQVILQTLYMENVLIRIRAYVEPSLLTHAKLLQLHHLKNVDLMVDRLLVACS